MVMAKIYIQTVTGSFEDSGQVEDARSYLLANGFEESELVNKPVASLTVFAATALEALEAADVLRNYGATSISAPNIL
jgi:hypothetical protein